MWFRRLAQPVAQGASSGRARPIWGALAVGAVASTGLASGPPCAFTEERSSNVPLGNRHRIAITNWPLVAPRKQQGYDETVKAFRGDFGKLCVFLALQGYEGVEISVSDLKNGGYYPKAMDDEEVVRLARAALQNAGLRCIGTLLHIADGVVLGPSYLTGLDINRHDFYEQFEKVLAQEKRLGSEYVTLQVDLPERLKGTGGAYRNDDEYLFLSAERIYRMQEVSFRLGLNFYVEAHIDRVSEDPEAFCKIFDYCPSYFEVNMDISHYLYRNIVRGPHVDRILDRVGHNHQRMARKHGDLSSDVGQHFEGDTGLGDCAADWDARGVTWQAVDAFRPLLERGGFSSRVIVGETGPGFGVKDALLLDTKLVPLWRLMARIAEGEIIPPNSNPFR